MPYINIRVNPELFLKYKGVKIYRMYQQDDINYPHPCEFTINPKETSCSGDSLEECQFDVRFLEFYIKSTNRPKDMTELEAQILAIEEAIDHGIINSKRIIQ